MQYRETRNYENLQKAMFDGVGRYEVAQIQPEHRIADNWIGFNYARGCEDPEWHGVHFFVDDYQFLRLWTNADAYINMLSRFQVVCTPDFSTYTDFPMAVQIYNHYRKHWLGAYWQANGITVIPTISWSDERSYEWCFDGEPVGGVVAVSSVGTQNDEECRRLFEKGYDEMMRRLRPSQVVMYGDIPDVCLEYGVGVETVSAFHRKWRKEGGEDE